MHTQLTLRNFSSYAFLAFTISLVDVGFGALDLYMVSGLGLAHVAAVGQGDLIAACILTTLLGIIDIFCARLAAAEGAGSRTLRQTALATGFLLAVIVAAVLAVFLTLVIRPALIAFRQVDELVNPIAQYVVVRLYGVSALLIYVAANEALKICGMRSSALYVLLIGFGINAALNGVFLFTQFASFFESPEAAVATATIAAHAVMAMVAFLILFRSNDRLKFDLRGFSLHEARNEFYVILKSSPSIGIRRLNDYAGTVIPLLFIGTMNTGVVVAASIATKVYTLFCRVPQAAFAATYVYYCYGLDLKADPIRNKETIRTLMFYSAIPTLVALALACISSRFLIAIFGTKGADLDFAQLLLFAYLAFVPVYFFEHFFGEILTAHRRGAILFWWSTLATYSITIPFAYLAVFHWQSALFAIACKGIAICLLAVVYWVSLHRQTFSEEGLVNV